MIDQTRGFAIMSDAGVVFAYEEDYGNAAEHLMVLQEMGNKGLKIWYADEADEYASVIAQAWLDSDGSGEGQFL